MIVLLQRLTDLQQCCGGAMRRSLTDCDALIEEIYAPAAMRGNC